MEQTQAYFEKLYQENYQMVIRLCMGYVKGDVALAKDLAQEVFIKVWQHLESFREESAISTWIYRIAVNTCLLLLRKKKYMKGSETVDKLDDNDTDTSSKREIQLQKMYRCIDQLSEENKGIILLELEGLPQKEIADITGISHSAVRVRIHRIKESLTQ
ncbi:MAG: RNA polymerase sigma factor, partial [Pricia sp.]